MTATLDTTRTRNTTLAAIWLGGEVAAFGSFPGAADDALEAILEWAFEFARARGWELVSE